MRANKMESACQQFSPESPSLSFSSHFHLGNECSHLSVWELNKTNADKIISWRGSERKGGKDSSAWRFPSLIYFVLLQRWEKSFWRTLLPAIRDFGVCPIVLIPVDASFLSSSPAVRQDSPVASPELSPPARASEICCLESLIDNSSGKESLLKVFKSMLHKFYNIACF